MTDGEDSELPPAPETMEAVDCPACDTPPERPNTVVYTDTGWWHAICLLESHPQVEQRSEKECPDCGTAVAYHPTTYGPEARSCPVCVTVFPEDASRRDDVTIAGAPEI